jgi:hypothetical protein
MQSTELPAQPVQFLFHDDNRGVGYGGLEQSEYDHGTNIASSLTEDRRSERDALRYCCQLDNWSDCQPERARNS